MSDLIEVFIGCAEQRRVDMADCTLDDGHAGDHRYVPAEALADEVKRLRSEVDETSQLCGTLAGLLTRTADALKGDPGPLTLHDWSDLPQVAEMALRMHQVQLERANRLEAEAATERAENARLRGVIAGELVRDGQAMDADRREVVGYVLVDPNTNAMDWDGLIHDTRDGAIKEAVSTLNLDDGDKQRPCCGADLWYEVGEVRRPAGLNEAVLAAAQAEWDRHRTEFLNG
ncbi:MAG TPA: hypothetical protein VGL39_27605 [Jatrophihabitantaceae bacterium]